MARLNYNHLRYFWAVAHEGSLTRAAEHLHLSQSALSVQIRKLEDRLGHPLFERRGRRLHLTEAGRVALDYADAIFAQGEALLGTLRGAGPRRVLRVGALATLSRNFQIGFLRPVLGRPDVEVILRSGGAGELLQALQALQLDVVLVNQAPSRDAVNAFVSHRIAEQQVSLVCTPERLGPGEPDLETLIGTQPLVLPTVDSSIRVGFDALVDRLGLQPRIAAEVDDMAMMRLMARADVGMAVVPPIVIKDELASRMLVEAAQLPGLSETFYAVTIARQFPNPILRELIDAGSQGSLATFTR